MADHVRSKPPAEWLIRVLNPALRGLLPTPAGRLFRSFGLLRFTGRRSGKPYAIPAGVYPHDDALVVFSDAPWVANFRGGTPVEVVRRGKTVSGHGEAISDPAYVGPAIRAVMAAGTSTTMLGLAIDRDHEPTDEELAAVRNAIVIRPKD